MSFAKSRWPVPMPTDRVIYRSVAIPGTCSHSVPKYLLKEAKAAKFLIEEGRLGKVYHLRSSGHRRRGRPFVDGYGSPTFVQSGIWAGGALYDMGVYHINTMLYLVDNPVVEPRIYRQDLSGDCAG